MYSSINEKVINSIIRNKLIKKKYKRIIIPQNRRNIKNKNLLIKLRKEAKNLLK